MRPVRGDPAAFSASLAFVHWLTLDYRENLSTRNPVPQVRAETLHLSQTAEIR
jgi:hypothetical protein